MRTVHYNDQETQTEEPDRNKIIEQLYKPTKEETQNEDDTRRTDKESRRRKKKTRTEDETGILRTQTLQETNQDTTESNQNTP